MEKMSYCRFCNEEHIVSETKDTQGNAVGLFCNREKQMITVFWPVWNGEDVYDEIARFVSTLADDVSLARLKPGSMTGLSRKFAYQFLQTYYATSRRINFYFAQHIVLDALRERKQRLYNVRTV